jgi:pyridoxine/pyridoxamine 5'-phosphate oxidase
MDTAGLLNFVRSHRLAVQASVSSEDAPQAAVVGYAVTDQFELVFDTLSSSRKGQNLRRNSRIALVIGGLADGEERTVQYEGIADEPSGEDLDRLKQVYYAAWPDGPSRLTWPGLTYFRVKPTWIRYSDFNANPPEIIEFSADQLVRPT